MIVRLGVLGSSTGWYFQDLARAASMRRSSGSRVSVTPLAFPELSTSYLGRAIARSRFPVADASAADGAVADSNDWDAILVRTMPLGSLEQTVFRMNALHTAERQGIRVVNPARSLEIAIDKWLTLECLARHGIEVPFTVCCQRRDQAMEYWQTTFQRDCVVKPLFGGEGRGIVRVTDADMAWRVFSTLEQLQAVIYLQEFLPSPGYDLRLLWIDDAVFCVRRENPFDWRTNAGRGGTFQEHEPTFEQVDLALRSAKAIGTWMAGVDILPTTCGRNVVLEVNAVPGWRSTASALQIDIAQFVLERIERTLETS